MNARQGGESDDTGAFYVQTKTVKRSASVLFLLGVVVVQARLQRRVRHS